MGLLRGKLFAGALFAGALFAGGGADITPPPEPPTAEVVSSGSAAASLPVETLDLKLIAQILEEDEIVLALIQHFVDQESL